MWLLDYNWSDLRAVATPAPFQPPPIGQPMPARRTILVAGTLLLMAAALLLAEPGRSQDPETLHPILGFGPAAAAIESQREREFLAIPSPEQARAWHRYLTAEPHPAASPRNNELAAYIAQQWKEQGWEDVVVRQYDVLHSSPRHTSLEMVAPVRFVARDRKSTRLNSSHLV